MRRRHRDAAAHYSALERVAERMAYGIERGRPSDDDLMAAAARCGLSLGPTRAQLEYARGRRDGILFTARELEAVTRAAAVRARADGSPPDPDSEAMSRVAMFLRRLAGEEVGGG